MELLKRFRQHDPKAAGEVYEKCGQLLLRLILNVVGDHQDAEDLLAEILLMAPNKLRAFAADEIDVCSWLLILGRNHALRFRADTACSREQSSCWRALESPPIYADSAEEYSASTSARTAFRNLPETNRLILELAWFEGLGVNEIASRLRLPAPEVIALATDSLTQIREC